MKVYEYGCKIGGVVAIAVGVGLWVNGLLTRETASILGLIIFFITWLSLYKTILEHIGILVSLAIVTALFIVETIGVALLANVIEQWYTVYMVVAIAALIIVQHVRKADYMEGTG